MFVNYISLFQKHLLKKILKKSHYYLLLLTPFYKPANKDFR